MQVFAASQMALLHVALVAAATVGRQSNDHPVVGVIGTLKELSLQVEQAGHDEAVLFMKYDKFCVDSARTLNKAILAEKEQIGSLTSTVKAKEEEIVALEAQASDLNKERTGHETAKASAHDLRESTADQYRLSKQDLDATVQAIADVLVILEGARDNTDSSLVQTKMQQLSLMPLLVVELNAKQRQALGVSNDPTNPAQGEHDKHVKEYGFKSHSVIELLKKLKIKFEDDRTEATKSETNSLNAYELWNDALGNALQSLDDAEAATSGALGLAKTTLLQASQDLGSQQGDLTANKQSLADSNAACDVKRSEWAERSALRTKELQALQAAVSILEKVSGVRTEAPNNPDLPTGPGFLAVEARAAGSRWAKSVVVAEGDSLFLKRKNDPKMRAVNLLRQVAQEEHSRVLERFAQQLEVSLSGPFDAINNMIQKMIFRLHAEQKNEDDHKHWCDTEVSKTEASSASKKEKVQTLNLQIGADKADSLLLVNSIAAAQEQIKDLNAHSALATEIRTAGKAENADAVKDAKAAQVAITKAIGIIEAYYKESGYIKKESWESFMQKREPVQLGADPPTWGAAYQGVADPANQPDGIVSLLKGVAQTFMQMQADSEAQEVQDQKAFDELRKDNKIEVTRLQTEVDVKTQENNRLLAKVTTLEQTKKHVSSELEATDQYYSDLAPACLDGDSTYADRKAARTSEIDALGEAQQILSDAFKAEVSLIAVDQAQGSFLAPVRRA